MKTIHLLILSLFLLIAVSGRASVSIGQAAPDFSLTDWDGKSHSLSQYRGKVVVLEWTNHKCPFVAKFYEPGQMQRWQKEMAENGVVWLVVNSGAPGKQGHLTPAQARSMFESKAAAPAAYLFDTDGRVGRAYGAQTTPHMYVIDSSGTLVYNGAIDSIRSANPADIARAENYVLSAVEAVKGGRPVATPTSRPYGCSVKY